ncbi:MULTISPECIES: alpha/beta fold hydrolase [unclassified Haematobacter]|uniref:alpha/beta fold hydrolase n=1 Tax=unclassified Haematobacter TaxID=2640585 RepID=UPI0025C0DAE5|nr:MULTISPECIES: alpha/beta hydrolase [unclassified Haematobacter]
MRLEPAPLHLGADGSSGAAAYWRRAEDGTRLRFALWPAAGALATVLLFPGRTEYVEKYDGIARILCDAGFATLAVDWRGQGLSAHRDPAIRMGDVENFRDYQQDVQAMLATAQALDMPSPTLLLAHSMGGAIARRALHEGLAVKAAAFSAPMWGLTLPGLTRPLAWLLSSVALRAGRPGLHPPGHPATPYVLTARPALNNLTSDPMMLARMRAAMEAHPELALGGPSLRWLHEALVEMRVLATLPPPGIPAYVGVGSDERVVDARAIRRGMAHWPGAEVEIFPGARHELMMEAPRHREHFMEQVISLYRSRVRS